MVLAITSITPDEGVTAGLERITILGTDFDINPFPPTGTGFVGDLADSVKVKIDLLYATRIWVFETPAGAPGDTTIECTVPRFTGDPSTLPALVDVVVENQLAPGSVTSIDGFKYKHKDAKSESVLQNVTRSLIQELRRQIPVPGIFTRVHTDYDPDTSTGINTVQISELPALEVSGPTIERTDGPYGQQDRETDLGGGDVRHFRAPSVCDLTYTIRLVEESNQRALNLTNMLTVFVDENGRLPVELVTGTPASGFVAFDMDWVDMPDLTVEGNNNNLLDATGTLIIRGVPVDRLSGVEIEKTYDIDEILFEEKPF